MDKYDFLWSGLAGGIFGPLLVFLVAKLYKRITGKDLFKREKNLKDFY